MIDADAFIAGTPARLPHIRRVLEHIVAAADEPDSEVWIALPRDIAAAFKAWSSETVDAEGSVRGDGGKK